MYTIYMYVLCVVYHLVTIAIIFITCLRLLMYLQVTSTTIFMSCDQKYCSIHVVIKSTVVFMSYDQKCSYYIHVSLQLLFTNS